MTISRCDSSILMTDLLTWRNSPPQTPVVLQAIKRGVAEIGLLFVACTAAVETVAYAVFKTASLALLPFSNKPFCFAAKKLESSSFTFIWAVKSLIYNNIFKPMLAEHESVARFNAHDIFLGNTFMRLEDVRYIISVIPVDLPRNSQYMNELIQEGGDFLKNEVFADLNNRDKQSTKDISLEIIPFILARSVYIFSCGTRKTQPLPLFFNRDTHSAIFDLRKKIDDLSEHQQATLKTAFQSLDQYESGIQEPELQKIFQDIKTASTLEVQNSIFSTACFKKAIVALSEDPIDQSESHNILTLEAANNNDC